MLYYVYTQPNASKTEYVEEKIISGTKYGMPGEVKALKIKVAKQAKDGEANKELIKFISKYYKKKKSSIEIIKGEKSRYKVLKITD